MEIVGVPNISFSHKFLLIATKENGQKKYFSSLNDYNIKVAPKNLLAGVDYSEEMDDPDSDGLKKLLNIQFDIFEAEIQKLDIYLFVTYMFDNRIQIEFTDMIKIPNNVKSGFMNRVVGHLDLIQNESFNEL